MRLRKFAVACIAGGSLLGGFYGYQQMKRSSTQVAPILLSSQIKAPKYTVTRKKVLSDGLSRPGITLTLFQYQNCPFCTKVRTFLDFYGFNYNLVEVHPITGSETKWSSYRKVPIVLVQRQGSDEAMQLHDSTQIISALYSSLITPPISSTEDDVLPDAYPVYKQGRKYHCPNRYFLMLGQEVSKEKELILKDERKWRVWADDILLHTISPNIYRSVKEGRDSIVYFDESGHWADRFSGVTRFCMRWFGPLPMYCIGKMVKRKYKISDNVRESLYGACDEWANNLKVQNIDFHGGDKPDLADLAVFGILNSIEGCQAFREAWKNTAIRYWYKGMKKQVENHAGLESIHQTIL